MMSFNRSYSDLLAILPDSVIQEGWAHLTTRKRKPLTETEASGINPIVESFLKHEAQRYQNKLMRQRQIKGCPTLCEHGTLETGIHMAGNEEIINKEITLLHKRLLEYNRILLVNICRTWIRRMRNRLRLIVRCILKSGI